MAEGLLEQDRHSLRSSSALLGLSANLLVIISFLMTPSLRNLRNYFIVNLALSDLNALHPDRSIHGLPHAPPFLAVRRPELQTGGVRTSDQPVRLLPDPRLAMDRFLLTLCPVKWRLAAKAPLAFYLVVWITAVLVALPYFFAPVDNIDPWNQPKMDALLSLCEMERPSICLERTWDRLPISRRSYVLLVTIIVYFLPLGSLGFAYSQIGATIRKRVKYNTTVDTHKKQRFLLLLTLVVTYAGAWLPMNLYNLLNVFDVIEFSQNTYIYAHLIGMLSPSINPILYALINDSFRNAFINLLRPFLTPCTKYIVVPPAQIQQNTTTYSSPRRDVKLPNEPSAHRMPLIHVVQDDREPRHALITPGGT
ncbi:Neuropeptide F receptor [Aphelenchoides fujianensis]|nr:Neuropeptide F receptor [Aphelenchoides fujianensis]